MKQFLLSLAFIGLVACSTPAQADHTDNGKCLDEIKHWNGLTDAQKREADAPNIDKRIYSAGFLKRKPTTLTTFVDST